MERLPISLPALIICIAACTPVSPRPQSVPYRGALLEVDNRGGLGLDVFALHTPNAVTSDTHARVPLTSRVHLGQVAAGSKTRFVIPAEFIYNKASPVHFIIDQINGRRAVVDQELIVMPVDTVSLTIPPI